MSYGEQLENTIIKLKVHSDIKESGFEFKNRKGMIEHLVQYYTQDEVLKTELEDLTNQIGMLDNLEESIKPFITTFYN